MALSIPKFGDGAVIAVTVLAALVILVLFHSDLSAFIAGFPYPQAVGLFIMLVALALIAAMFSKVTQGSKEKFASRWLYIYAISAVILMLAAWWVSKQSSLPFSIFP